MALGGAKDEAKPANVLEGLDQMDKEELKEHIESLIGAKLEGLSGVCELEETKAGDAASRCAPTLNPTPTSSKPQSHSPFAPRLAGPRASKPRASAALVRSGGRPGSGR